jgi:5-methylcytosine-specific restriction endonuclease McrA
MKVCKHCSQAKEDSCFRAGFTCKECESELNKIYKVEYHKKHKEQEKEYRHKYYIDNKETRSEYFKKWRSENVEKEALRHRKYRQENNENILIKRKEYLKEHPEKLKEFNHNRRARKANAIGQFKSQEWLELCEKYNNKCACCGKEGNLTVDHIIPLSSGGTNYIENIQPLCSVCNSIKATKTIDYRFFVEAYK